MLTNNNGQVQIPVGLVAKYSNLCQKATEAGVLEAGVVGEALQLAAANGAKGWTVVPASLLQQVYLMCGKAYDAGVTEADEVGEMLYLEGYDAKAMKSWVCTKVCCQGFTG